MTRSSRNIVALIGAVLATASSFAQVSSASPKQNAANIAVAAQYDTTHVYVSPENVDPFVKSFLGTFGGTSTAQVIATVTPTPSRTSSQLLQTPVGTVSLFGFMTPVPAPFGAERTGYLVKDLDVALRSVQKAGGEVVVAAFPDPIGRDAVVRFPGGLMTQLYWHTKSPSYAALLHVPENRVYLSADAVDGFLHSFISFADAHIVFDDRQADGRELSRPGYSFRRVGIESLFGKMTIFVTDGILPYPYGIETTGYEVSDLDATLTKARRVGVVVLSEPITVGGRQSAMVRFPGGYVAEIHSLSAQQTIKADDPTHTKE